MGTLAPDIIAESLTGQKVSLADLRGKLVFVDFWATWCAPCVAELPNVRKAYDAYAGDGLVIIGISLDATPSVVKSFVDERKIPWAIVVAEGGNNGPLALAYGVAGIPATFLIGPDGKVVANKDLRGEALHTTIKAELEKMKGTRVSSLP